jgi:hypothetical protein
MGMKALARRVDAVTLEELAQLLLEGDQPGGVIARETSPERLGPAHIRKSPDAAGLELEPPMSANHAPDRRLEGAHLRDREVSEEMQREMNTLDGVRANPVGQRRQSVDWSLQPLSNVLGRLDGDEDTPALRLIAGCGCQRSP